MQTIANKKIILILCLISLISSLFFRTVHSEHHCKDENCPVCFILTSIKNQLKDFFPEDFQKIFSYIILFSLSGHIIVKWYFKLTTLYNQKVRLNN